MPEVYAPEPGHANAWCYYFEKADLARQFGDWEEVVSIAETALKLDEQSHDPLELFVFIEGYAHVGKWQRAIELSRDAQEVSEAEVRPLLCLLWERIETETAESLERGQVLSEVKSIFACNP